MEGFMGEGMMRVKAAVLRGVREPYTIEELELELPKLGEVLVKYTHCGYCHSDYSVVTGGIPSVFPVVAGHECAGIVEEVGPGVTKIKKGDHVVGTFSIPCGQCSYCQSGELNLCGPGNPHVANGTLLDGTTRFKDSKGNTLYHTLFLSGFSTHGIVPEDGLIPVPQDLSLEKACLLSCCVPTGWGAVTNIANVKPGDSVVVYGLGGVGLNVLRAAAVRQAYPLIAIDLEEDKESLAYEFGATHFICNAKEDPVPRIQALTGKGARFVFEVIGDSGAVVQALWSTCIGGHVIAVGVTPISETATMPLFLITLHQKAILGAIYGGTMPQVDIPRFARMAAQPDLLKLDKLITNKFRLEQINDVVDAMARRQIKGRWVCELE
jgi:S-(hydroxymethyl)glutathione dehydrogenase/alcohol dehydrogenase